MERLVEWRAHIRGCERIGERDCPWNTRGLSVAAAGKEATESTDDMAQGDSRREYVARGPQGQSDPADVPERNDDRENQPTVKDAARAGQRQKLAGIARERTPVRDEQQQLRADECADDDVDAEIEDPRLIEASRLGSHGGELQAEQVRRRQKHAIGVDGDGTQLKQSWIHGTLRAACRESLSSRRWKLPSRPR